MFLYEPDTDSLVAMGTSQTPLGKLQCSLGLHWMSVANGSPPARVFETGEPYCCGAIERDPTQPRGRIERLGIRSQMDVPLDVNGERRGVLGAASTAADHFTDRDLVFFQPVAGGIGMITHRAELFEEATRLSAAQGRLQAGDEIGRLTPRQREIAICVAEGLTNEQIAARLVVTPGTVANHLGAILRRLVMSHRSQIAVWTVEMGLYRSAHEGSND